MRNLFFILVILQLTSCKAKVDVQSELNNAVSQVEVKYPEGDKIFVFQHSDSLIMVSQKSPWRYIFFSEGDKLQMYEQNGKQIIIHTPLTPKIEFLSTLKNLKPYSNDESDLEFVDDEVEVVYPPIYGSVFKIDSKDKSLKEIGSGDIKNIFLNRKEYRKKRHYIAEPHPKMKLEF